MVRKSNKNQEETLEKEEGKLETVKISKSNKAVNDNFQRLRNANSPRMEFIGGDNNIKSFKISDSSISLIIEIDIDSGKVIGGQLR